MERDDERRTDRQAGRPTERQTGPWVLALGVLAIGVGAVVRELRRNRAGELGGASDEDDT